MKQEERDELLVRLDEHIRDIRKDLKKMDKTLFGNGREGLCTIVGRHKVYFTLMGTSIIFLIGVMIKFIFE